MGVHREIIAGAVLSLISLSSRACRLSAITRHARKIIDIRIYSLSKDRFVIVGVYYLSFFNQKQINSFTFS